MEPALRPMTATSAGDVTLAVLGFGVLALFVLLILWAILVKLRLPPAVKLTARLRARQTRRHEQAARALGLEYTEDDPGLLDVPLSLMSWGTKRWIHHVSYGTYRGRDVHLFRLYFQVPGGRYGPTLSSRRGALAWIDAAFPHIVIEHRGVFEAAEGIHGAELLHFEPEFDEVFRVRSTDPELAAEILDSNVRRWLLETDRHWRFEFSGPWVLAYEESSRDRVDERGMLDMVSDLADRVPWILLQQHPSGSEADPDPLPVGPAPHVQQQQRRRHRSKIAGVASSAVILLFLAAGVVVGVASEPGATPTISIPPPSIPVPSFVPPSIAIPSIGPPTPAGPTPTLTAGSDRPIVLAGLRSGEQVTVTFLGLFQTPGPSPPPGRKAPPSNLGAKFLIVNTGTVPYEDFPGNGILLLDAAGKRNRPELLDTFTPALGKITLHPGERVAGFVSFRLPASATPAALVFQTDSGFGPQTGRWNL